VKRERDYFAFAVNGHTLTGEKRGGRWSFKCPAWPEVAGKHEGAATIEDVVADFMRLACGQAVEARAALASFEVGGKS